MGPGVVCSVLLSRRSVLVPLLSYQKGLRAKLFVVPSESDDADVSVTLVAAGVLEIARKGGEMGELLEKFCREHLCLESWDFIVDVCKYETLVSLVVVRGKIRSWQLTRFPSADVRCVPRSAVQSRMENETCL